MDEAHFDNQNIHGAISDHTAVKAEIKTKIGNNKRGTVSPGRLKQDYDLKSVCVSVDKLKEMIQLLEGRYDNIELLVGDDLPLVYLGTARSPTGATLHKTGGVIAPRVNHQHYNQEAFNIFPYYVECSECGWEDGYSTETKAVKAGEDHRYFEGHQFEIITPQGEKLEKRPDSE